MNGALRRTYCDRLGQRCFTAAVRPDDLADVAVGSPSLDQIIQSRLIGRLILVRKQVRNLARTNAMSRKRIVNRGQSSGWKGHGSSPMVDRLTDVKLGVELFVEIEHAIEMTLLVLLRLFHQSDIDHIENDIAKAIRFVDAPTV